MFYVQVARLEDPEGAGREPLLIVGGSPDGRGVVTSASYEVRRFGVRSAMPTAQALRLCPEAMVVGVPRGACARRSREVRRTLQELSPVVQAASIDEFYLDLSGTERLFRGETLEHSAHRIRNTVLERTRISVSIGGATQRRVAKLAAEVAKPGGVHVVPPGGELAFMRRLRLRDIPGIGPSLLDALRRRGLDTVEDALGVQREWLERWFGPARGHWLHDVVRGVDPTPVTGREARKSISSERTFPRDLTTEPELEEALLRQVSSVARTLRHKGLRARTVTVKIRDGDFTTRQASRTLGEPVESDRAIYRVARGLLSDLRARRRAPCRLLGVGLSNLADQGDPPQLAIFEDERVAESERDRSLARAVDDVRDRFGEESIIPGRMLDS